MTKPYIPGTADWGMSEHLAAAAALGRFANIQIKVLCEISRCFGDDDPVHRAANLALERAIVAATVDAASHADAAEYEAGAMAQYLTRETREYQEYVEQFPRRDPRD